MLAKVFRIVCYVIAGFFIHTVSILAFAKSPSVAFKAALMAAFAVPAVGALVLGFALNPVRRKLRDTGLVLLSSAGVTAFQVLTFVCVLQDPEIRNMLQPDTLAFFSDYIWGFGFMVVIATTGVIAIDAGSRRPANA